MSRKELETFLYKHKINQLSLIDLLPKLSSKTIKLLIKDLDNINTNDTDTIYIFTDGSCTNNGRKNAKGGYAVFFTDDTQNPLYELNTQHTISEPTNQKAELLAIQKAFQLVCLNNNHFENKNIVIVSDSMYSIKCIETWSENWIKNNWITSKKEPVKNADIIKQILELKNKNTLNISFKHVFSHTLAPNNENSLEYKLWYGNNIADKMTRQIIE